jgi:glycerophosphoryl diester phosphodiesterase
MAKRSRPHVLISAHRCGGSEGAAYDNTPVGVRHAAAIGADYVEFDVRRTADGAFVCTHGREAGGLEVAASSREQLRAAAPEVADLDEVLGAVVETGLGAHVDLKGAGVAEWAVAAADACAARLDTGPMILTTGDARAAAALARWAQEHPGAQGTMPLVGLTVGQSTSHLRLPAALRARIGELYPTRRWRASGAGVLVAHHLLARVRLLRWAHRREVRVLVWTVDSPRTVAAALRDPRVWMVTTNHPAAAIAARHRLGR